MRVRRVLVDGVDDQEVARELGGDGREDGFFGCGRRGGGRGGGGDGDGLHAGCGGVEGLDGLPAGVGGLHGLGVLHCVGVRVVDAG